ncbi:MAG: hypothetical protein ABH828_00690 [archaeon]
MYKSKENEYHSNDYDSSESLYVVNNHSRGACKGTCRSMGVCTCS